jgi:hypothetical protein
MTESEWLACIDPMPMLEFLAGKVSDRKLRLFAVSCCRRIWHLLTDERSRCLVEKVEKYADGLITVFDVSSVWDIHEKAYLAYDFKAPYYAAMAVGWDFKQTSCEATHAAECAIWWDSIPEDDPIISVLHSSGRHAEAEAQCLLLRDIFGNPYRSISLDSAWLTPTVISLAQTAYDDRILPGGILDKARLAVLTDALEDAGCTDAVILSHCRQPGVHVRGCWLLDLILSKDR